MTYVEILMLMLCGMVLPFFVVGAGAAIVCYIPPQKRKHLTIGARSVDVEIQTLRESEQYLLAQNKILMKEICRLRGVCESNGIQHQAGNLGLRH